MLGGDKLLAAVQELVPGGGISQVAFVLPQGAIAEQVSGTLIGGAVGAAAGGGQGLDDGSVIGMVGVRLGQHFLSQYPAYVLGLSTDKIYLFGAHQQGIARRSKGLEFVTSWDRNSVTISDKQVGISHHVTISPTDGGEPLTLEGKALNTGLPEFLKAAGSVHQG